MKTFEEFLQDKFFDLKEVDGVPIIKDNFEVLFDQWLENQALNIIIDLAEKWGEIKKQEGREEVEKLANAIPRDNTWPEK